MQLSAKKLGRLEQLLDLVDKYNPIKFESGETTRQLGREIAIKYGEVQSVYREYAGKQRVELIDGGHRKLFPNFFEAGFLSGRTVHAAEGYRELLRVIGQAGANLKEPSDRARVINEQELPWNLLHPKVIQVAADRFRATHYADAVEAVFKALNNEVREIVMARGHAEMDGASLMHTAFSPNSPIIELADLGTQSGKSMQQGYMEMFAGAMSAIRNPKAHDNIIISPNRAIHFLFVASTLWQTLDDRPTTQSSCPTG